MQVTLEEDAPKGRFATIWSAFKGSFGVLRFRRKDPLDLTLDEVDSEEGEEEVLAGPKKSIVQKGAPTGAKSRSWIVWLFVWVIGSGVLFFLGLKHSFPGESIAAYAERQLLNRFQMPSQIAPLELGWWSIQAPHISLDAPESLKSAQLTKLIEVADTNVGWLPVLLTQELQLETLLYESPLKLNLDLSPMNEATLNVDKLHLDYIPLIQVLPYAFLRGIVSLHGNVSNIQAILNKPNTLPQGSLYASIKDVSIKLKDPATWLPEQYALLLSGIELPNLNLSSVTLDVNSGKSVELKTLRLRGDLDGRIDGNIRLRPKRWESSQLKLRVEVTIAEKVFKKLGSLTMPLQMYLCDRTINVDITGTFTRLRTKKRKCK